MKTGRSFESGTKAEKKSRLFKRKLVVFEGLLGYLYIYFSFYQALGI